MTFAGQNISVIGPAAFKGCSNLTTLATALVLFAVGTGAVKGFALVLMIGILCSLFTAITVSRAIVNALYGGKKNLKKLPI